MEMFRGAELGSLIVSFLVPQCAALLPPWPQSSSHCCPRDRKSELKHSSCWGERSRLPQRSFSLGILPSLLACCGTDGNSRLG
uniref:Secreted protein n=1 Tax=Laticauda laticaudata TaxID=8630 RepID=A0A8C5SGA5_LATLA